VKRKRAILWIKHNGYIIFLPFPLSTNYPSHPYNHRGYTCTWIYTQWL